MQIIIVGFGTVGQGLVEIFQEKKSQLSAKGFHPKVVGVATGSRGILYDPHGLNLTELLAAIRKGNLSHYPDHTDLRRDFVDARALIRSVHADVLVEASPTNLETAEPAMTYFRAALETNKHIVTANKGPVALYLPELCVAAGAKGLQVRYEATVMAGTPSIATGLELLSGCTIHEARGIFNGTTNYILAQMESGLSYAAALQQAQELGYAETDPSGDVEGWDAAGKVLILMAALYNKKVTLEDLDVMGITGITQSDIQDAAANGERYKLIASATPEAGSVQLVRLPESDPLAQVGGATNAITYRTDLLGDVTLVGAGAGRKETGYGLLVDLLALA